MKLSSLAKLVFAALLVLHVSVAFSFDSKPPALAVYPAPANAELMNDFTVKVRQKDLPWRSLPVYLVKVDQVKGAKHSTENASMSYFDFSGEVEVSVTFNKGNITQSRIRPLSYNILHTVK